jgi:hypothetical protein
MSERLLRDLLRHTTRWGRLAKIRAS